MYFPVAMATSFPSYFPLFKAASASPMTIWAGKQMSLWTYFFAEADRLLPARPAAAPRGAPV